MNTEIKRIEDSKIEMTVTFEEAEWKAAQKKALNKLASQVSLPGFRKGRAPKNMIKARLGAAYIREQATEDLLQEKYSEIFIANNIKLIAQPTASVQKQTDDELVVVFTCPVAPEITLGEYKGLEVAKDEVVVTDEEIDNRLKTYQEQFAELLIKEDGAVEKGDTATIDYEGFKDGVAFEGGKGENHPLEIGSNSFIPGFEDQLIGMTTGEEKEIQVTFPEDYQAADLAGAEAVFKVKINEIKTKILPEIDDDLALDVNLEGVETLEQLKEHIKNEITVQKESAAENKFRDAIVKKLIENTPFDVPEAMVENEMQDMVSEINQSLRNQGLDMETYQKLTGKTIEDVKNDLKDQAVERVKYSMILEAIVAAENIEVTQDDVDAELQDIAAAYAMDLEKVKEILAPQEAGLRRDIANRKAMDLVVENVK